MPRALMTMPSWLLLTRPSQMILPEHDCLRIVCQREDVFGQLHAVVAGVERAGASSSGNIDRQEIPPRIGLAVADVVCCNLIVFILYNNLLHQIVALGVNAR